MSDPGGSISSGNTSPSGSDHYLTPDVTPKGEMPRALNQIFFPSLRTI